MIAGAIIVGLILVLALLRHFMQPERLSANLLAQAEAATGLDLELASAADISLWPDLNIVLRGLQARTEAGARPLLSAERVELALPWRTLWGGEIKITALRLYRPRLDRDALAGWLGARPTQVGPAAPARLPQLEAELLISHGSVVGRARDAWALRDIELRLSRLLPDEDFRLSLALQVHEGETRIPLQLEAGGRLHAAGMPLELAPLALRWIDDTGEDLLRLNGQLELAWPHRLSLMLSGRGQHWPEFLPALPAAAGDAEADYELGLDFRGTPNGTGPLQLRFSRGSLQSNLDADFAELLTWFSQPGQRLLPPARGSASLPLLERDGLRVEGLRIELGEDTGANTATDEG